MLVVDNSRRSWSPVPERSSVRGKLRELERRGPRTFSEAIKDKHQGRAEGGGQYKLVAYQQRIERKGARVRSASHFEQNFD